MLYNGVVRGRTPRAVAAWPAPLKTLVLVVCVSPTMGLFVDIWRDAGMFDSIAQFALAYRCA